MRILKYESDNYTTAGICGNCAKKTSLISVMIDV